MVDFKPDGTTGQPVLQDGTLFTDLILVSGGDAFNRPFTLRPGEKHTVTLKISIPDNKEGGEYPLTILFKAQASETGANGQATGNQSGSAGSQVAGTIGSNLIITIAATDHDRGYLSVETIETPTFIDSFFPISFHILAKSGDNATTASGSAVIRNWQAQDVATFNFAPDMILANATRRLRTSPDLAQAIENPDDLTDSFTHKPMFGLGLYTIAVHLNHNGSSQSSGQSSLTTQVVAFPFSLLAALIVLILVFGIMRSMAGKARGGATTVFICLVYLAWSLAYSPTPARAIEEETTVKATVGTGAAQVATPSPSASAGPVVTPIAPVEPGQGLQNVISALPDQFQKIGPYAGFLSSALPLITAISFLLQLGSLSPMILVRLLQAIGLLPRGKPQGLVFDSDSLNPVAFSVLTITNQLEGKAKPSAPVRETVVTDVDGVYRGIKLPLDEYRISVTQQNYIFPTLKQRPNYLTFAEYYRGEIFSITSEKQEPLFLVDPKHKPGQATWRSRLQLYSHQLLQLTSKLLLPLFVISGILALVFPSLLNWLIFALYAIMVVFQAIKWFKTPIIEGDVMTETGKTLAHAMLRFSLVKTGELLAVISSDENGHFRIYGPPEKYQLSVAMPGYLWQQAAESLSTHEVDATHGQQTVEVKMRAV